MKINNTVQDWVSCTVLKKPEFFFVPGQRRQPLKKPVVDDICFFAFKIIPDQIFLFVYKVCMYSRYTF